MFSSKNISFGVLWKSCIFKNLMILYFKKTFWMFFKQMDLLSSKYDMLKMLSSQKPRSTLSFLFCSTEGLLEDIHPKNFSSMSSLKKKSFGALWGFCTLTLECLSLQEDLLKGFFSNKTLSKVYSLKKTPFSPKRRPLLRLDP